MQHVFRRGYQNDLSFESVGGWLERYFHELNTQPLSDEAIAKGKEILELAEKRRQEEMAKYAEEKLCAASNTAVERDAPQATLATRPSP